MNRIMIFGRPGSGKSTFAYQLAEKTGFPLHHLDKHFFVAGWVERNNQEFMQIQEDITKGSAWIIEVPPLGRPKISLKEREFFPKQLQN